MGQFCATIKHLRVGETNGCQYQVVTGTSLNLSSDEMALLYESWERAKADDIGQRMLVSLLVKRPRLAAYFDVLPGTSEELMKAPQVRIHGYRIAGFFDSVICAIGFLPENKLNEMIRRVGFIHFHKGVNFNAENWLLFKRVLLEELCKTGSEPPAGHDDDQNKSSGQRKSRGNEELTVAWSKLLRVVIAEMKRGFLEEAVKSCASDINE